jgi:hypothetical protein
MRRHRRHAHMAATLDGMMSTQYEIPVTSYVTVLSHVTQW